jgi:hypothetical protein
MTRRFVVVILLFAGALGSAPLLAHHSAAATYFEDKSQTVEGTLVQFIYRNPHAFVYVEAPDPATGQPARWAVEWTSGQALNGIGITRETLKAGDHVVITGSPGRNAAEHRLRMRKIVRAKDGWKWEGNFQ